MVNINDLFKSSYEKALKDNSIVNIEFINKKLSEVKSIIEGLGMLLAYSKKCDLNTFNYCKEVYKVWNSKLSVETLNELKNTDIDISSLMNSEEKEDKVQDNSLIPITSVSKERLENILTVTNSKSKYFLDEPVYDSVKINSLKEESIIASCPKEIYTAIVRRKEIFKKIQKDNNLNLNNKIIRFENSNNYTDTEENYAKAI